MVPWVDDSAPFPSPPGPSQVPAVNELESLHQKYDKKYGKPKSAAASPFGPMATSHLAHGDYMREFKQGLEEMGVDTSDDPYLNAYVGPDKSRRGPLARSGLAHQKWLGLTSPNQPSRRAGSPFAVCGTLVTGAAGSGARWKEGPENAMLPVKEWTSVKHGKEVLSSCSSGRVVDLSDRNIMCMSLRGEMAVCGSADHGLKEINVRTGTVSRTLYTKRYGHSEWVTTVSHCRDGRIISGGMDSKLCLWNASGVVCVDLTGHVGSVSRVRASANEDVAISSGYDRTLRAWDLRRKGELGCCTGHDASITEFVWADGILASGDRSGIVKAWDANTAQALGTLRGHKGHITAMLALPGAAKRKAAGELSCESPLLASGAQDGHLRIWDLRQKLNAYSMAAHPGGAINEIGITTGSNPVIITVGADGRLLGFDPRANFEPLMEFGGITSDFIYSMLVLNDLVFTGDGRGRVTCFDVPSKQKLYVLDAGQNAIRCMAATEKVLVCAGDDGNALMFDF
ncbi:unnamed protein product [Effrenium voratum]|nr:unnamed protein product [Effrenium voratum]